jgi:PAS domain S-box-containing protein
LRSNFLAKEALQRALTAVSERLTVQIVLGCQGRSAMLLTGRVLACYGRAAAAKRKAEATRNPAKKADFLEMEKGWLSLARSLEASERLTDFIGTAKVNKDLGGIITGWNKGAEELFGYSVDEAVGQPGTLLIPPGRLDEDYAILQRVQRGGRVDNFETVRRRKDGSLINVSLTASPIKGTEGKVVGVVKIARDITQRKRTEAQVVILAREAEHRAKNLLANLRAMVRLSQSDTREGLREAIEGRIEALANVHSLFVQSRWAGAELGRLVEQELSPYSMRARIDGPSIMLNPELAQAMAIALHELATNAAKYGSLSVAEGYVRVEWVLATDRRLVLRWSEVGGPPVKLPTRSGFGTDVMEAMIRDQLKGEVRLDWRAEGLACEMTLPT